MKKFISYLVLSFLVMNGIYGQISRITENILENKKETPEKESSSGTKRDSLAVIDSLKIVELMQQIQQMKLNEIIYLDGLERSKTATISDSIKKARRIARIDSLRKVTNGAPLVIEDDTLFTFYAARGGVTFKDRAINTRNNIYDLGEVRSVRPDSIYLFRLEDGNQIEIMYHNKVISSVTKDDALWMNISIDSLAAKERAAIVDAVKLLQKKNSLLEVLKRIGLFVLIIVVQVVLIFSTNWLYRRFKRRIVHLAHKKFKPIVIREYEFLDTKREARIVIFFVNIIRYLLIFVQLLFTVPMLFSIFPQTKELAVTLFGYVTNPIKSIFSSILNYIPNLFTIVIIYFSIKYLIKGINFLAKEVESERLKIPGFYPDWALPSYNIIRFLLYAFMIAMIYPYLPGSSSGVFQGISVFVGLIVSLGSSTVIGNIIAGLVITYMRPFKLGDRIKLNDTLGNVIEKTPFVTRIKTPKNEIITIPNSFIMSSHTTNYSVSAKEYGLIVHSNVSIGYEVPWQKAHECLIRAAKETSGTIKTREPFVLDFGLEDYYNLYQINVYISDADLMPRVVTELNSRIQDIFLEEGIDIESPMLVSERKDPRNL